MGFCVVIMDILVTIAFHEVTSLHPFISRIFHLYLDNWPLHNYMRRYPVHCIVMFLYIQLQVYSLGKGMHYNLKKHDSILCHGHYSQYASPMQRLGLHLHTGIVDVDICSLK